MYDEDMMYDEYDFMEAAMGYYGVDDDSLYEEKFSFGKKEEPKKRFPFGGGSGNSKSKPKKSGKLEKIKPSEAMDGKRVAIIVAGAVAATVTIVIVAKKLYAKLNAAAAQAQADYGTKDDIKEVIKSAKEANKGLKKEHKKYRKELKNAKTRDERVAAKINLIQNGAQRKGFREDIKDARKAKAVINAAAGINKIIGVVQGLQRKIKSLATKLKTGISEFTSRESALVEQVVRDYVTEMSNDDFLDSAYAYGEDVMSEAFDGSLDYDFDDDYDDFF